jgi:DNA-directed DNA polymerase III PolC
MLNYHTYYSLRYGVIAPAQLVKEAYKRGLKTLVLTDINNVSCAFEFVQRCKEANIRPILGIEFRQQNQLRYIGIAKNMEGFEELNRLLSEYTQHKRELPLEAPALRNAFIIYPRLCKDIRRFKDYEFLGIRPEYVGRIYKSPVEAYLHKLVAWCPMTFLDTAGYEQHKVLRAIDLNTLITKLEPKDMAKRNELFHEQELIAYFYRQYPQLIQNSHKILNDCSANIKYDLQHNKRTFTSSKKADMELLYKLALKGSTNRYAGSTQNKAQERLGKELLTIDKQDFASYFLITWDIIRYAQSMGYHHVGRGSGANSIVAFCLGITDVDPLDLDLYFERFINPYRKSPPDFDIDFSWDERDDVIDYVFKRYGSEHTALLATYSTFKTRSAVREIAKVYGLPKAETDLMLNDPTATEKHHELSTKIWTLAKSINGLPNYLSIHAGGILIAEAPIFKYTALQQMPKGFPITQFDMHHAEAIGFHKYDVLSQRGLGHIKEAVRYIKENKGISIDVHEVERIKKDNKVKDLLRSGSCIGCFYIESPAMRNLLSKLRCDNYVHLVAASSIIRPGVAKSGMMREYIQRFHQPNSFKYIHPVFEEQLGETFGVMVYQEDVMKIVHHFADLDLNESDVLRRIMSGKKDRNDNFSTLKRKFFENCKAKGYTITITEEVWRQVESFSGYSFCKAHSASFAVESFQSLYLKAYYPLEFIVAVINNFGGFYSTELYFHEAKMLGADIYPPCINKSRTLSHVEHTDIYVGFAHLQQMEQKTIHRILHQRGLSGPFKTMQDFTNRVQISSEQLDILIRIGAFRFTGLSKCELMWEKNAVFNPSKKKEVGQVLFQTDNNNITLPNLEESPLDQYFDELELLGFSIESPFKYLKKQALNGIYTRQLNQYKNRIIRIYGYFVCRKRVSTSTKKQMNFGTWLDRDGQFFDTVHFPKALEKFPFRGKGIYEIEGKVVEDFTVQAIEVVKMNKLPFQEDKRY